MAIRMLCGCLRFFLKVLEFQLVYRWCCCRHTWMISTQLTGTVQLPFYNLPLLRRRLLLRYLHERGRGEIFPIVSGGGGGPDFLCAATGVYVTTQNIIHTPPRVYSTKKILCKLNWEKAAVVYESSRETQAVIHEKKRFELTLTFVGSKISTLVCHAQANIGRVLVYSRLILPPKKKQPLPKK